MSRLAIEDFGKCHALVLGLVRQHWTPDHVADGMNARDIGLVMVIDFDPALGISRHTGLVKTKSVRIRNTSHRHQHHVGLERFNRTARRRFGRQHHLALGFAGARHLGRQLEGEALFLQHALEVLGHIAVHARQDAVEIFDHRHLRAEPGIDRSQLEPDDPGPDHRQSFRHGLEFKCAGRRDDLLLVDVDALELRHVGAGGDDDMSRLDCLGANTHLARCNDLSRAAEHRHLVLLEQEVDALGIAVDGLLLEAHHFAEVDGGRRNDPHLGKAVPRLVIKLRGMQQCLRWNAADIQAGAAMRRPLFDNRDLEAKLGAADGADIASGSGADDGDVKRIRHGLCPDVLSAPSASNGDDGSHHIR